MIPALEIEDLAVDVARRRVLDRLQLTLEPEAHVLLVGPSGSGKSSLLRAIAGLLRPAAGRILIAGRVASEGSRLTLKPHQRGIGMLFQGGALWPHLSVQRTLEFVLSCQKIPRAERGPRRADLLEQVGLLGLEKRLPSELSGGEAQRLGLARASITRPKLLLLDEPLGPLDSNLRQHLLELLASLQRRFGFATLHVTHDPAEASRLATRVLHLSAGKLEPWSEIKLS